MTTINKQNKRPLGTKECEEHAKWYLWLEAYDYIFDHMINQGEIICQIYNDNVMLYRLSVHTRDYIADRLHGTMHDMSINFQHFIDDDED